MMKKKKRKLNMKRISCLVIFLLCCLIIICLFSGKDEKVENNNLDIKEKKDKVYTLKLIMAGDALINDYLYTDAYRQGNNQEYNFKPYLRLIKDKVKDNDLAYYNQETIIGGKNLGLSSYPAFNSPEEIGDAMIDTGFNIVSLATNHTLDRGKQAVLNSREYWNKQENIISVGSYSSFEEKTVIESKIYEKNGIKYAILNYTYGTNGIPVPSGEDYLVNVWDVGSNYEKYKEKVISDINNLRGKVDVLMVAMHWGTEYTHKETEIQRKTADFLAEHGVDIIIGTHPHVIEPVKWINNTLVFYSLGNFISSQTSSSCTNYKCSIGLLSSLTITKTINDDGEEIKIDNINNDLIYTYHNDYHDYLVIPFSNSEIKNYLNNYEEIYKEYSKIIASDDERIKTVSLVN